MRCQIPPFIEKAVGALEAGYHLLILDLWAPGTYVSEGLHAAIWLAAGGAPCQIRTDQPLTLAAYEVRGPGMFHAYVEPFQAGANLPDMPLFLAPEHYINVPLEPTYMGAWEGVPERWRTVIESSAAPA